MEHMSWSTAAIWTTVIILAIVFIATKLLPNSGMSKAYAWWRNIGGTAHPPAPAPAPHHPNTHPSPAKHGLGVLGKGLITLALLVLLILAWVWLQADFLAEARSTTHAWLESQVEWAKANPALALSLGVFLVLVLYGLWMMWKPQKKHGVASTPSGGHGHGHEPKAWEQFKKLSVLVAILGLLVAVVVIAIIALKRNQMEMDAEYAAQRYRQQIIEDDQAVRKCGTDGNKDCICHGTEKPTRILGPREEVRINTKGMRFGFHPSSSPSTFIKCPENYTSRSQCTYGMVYTGAAVIVINQTDAEMSLYCKYLRD